MSDLVVADAGRLRARGVLSPLDWHFSRTLAALANEGDASVILAAALVSRAVSQGHVCLDLAQLTEQRELSTEAEETVSVEWPAVAAWTEALHRSSLVGDGEGAAATPLVLDGTRLYSRRYWRYEVDLADRLSERCSDVEPALGEVETRGIIERLFGAPAGETDWQRVAAVIALTRRLCVLTGGPGTGKTHTVANLLALLAEDGRRRRGRLPEVLLLAPTGKAAHRLSASLAASAARLDCAADVRALVASKAKTIHRALGRDVRSRTRFRHDEHDPLGADVVVVDEASMVDIALMARLLAAVPARARVVLLGDRDQLSSVEAGAILGDLCGDARQPSYSAGMASRIESLAGNRVPVYTAAGPPIADSIVALQRNYRYAADSGIGRLAAAINDGDADAALALLDTPAGAAMMRPALGVDTGLYQRATAALAGCFAPGDARAKLDGLEAFRILCAFRRGPFGVEGLNYQIESRLRGLGWIAGDRESYPGRPVMIRHNDRETGLFNGDVGILLEDERGLRAHFSEGEVAREVSLGRLPSHETVYAMTIHKSQGSEFDEVSIVLPDKPSPLLTRELLYTAVTRARRQVTIHATAEIVRRAVARRVERASGLRERLWRD